MNAGDVRKYAAEQGIAEGKALKKGMEAKGERVCGKGLGGLREGVNLLNVSHAHQ